jgi:gamma-glutamyl AIG2-like cyclotransferase
MDNAVTIPGYKYFVAPDGSRPDVCVAFLDVHPQPGAAVNGVCVPVDLDALALLDERERNYERIDVTVAIEPVVGPTWVYVGRAESRERYAAAAAEGRAVVASEYLAAVEHGFRSLGDEAWAEFGAGVEDHRPPLRELRRVDVPRER